MKKWFVIILLLLVCSLTYGQSKNRFHQYFKSANAADTLIKSDTLTYAFDLSDFTMGSIELTATQVSGTSTFTAILQESNSGEIGRDGTYAGWELAPGSLDTLTTAGTIVWNIASLTARRYRVSIISDATTQKSSFVFAAIGKKNQ